MTHPTKVVVLAAIFGAAAIASPTFAQTDNSGAASTCTGIANVACIIQIGDRNRITIDQTAALGSRAMVFIRGNDNGGGQINSARLETTSRVYCNPAQCRTFPNHPDNPGKGHDKNDDGIDDHDPPGMGLGHVPGAAAIETPTLESGIIHQTGEGHEAHVGIIGNENQYHITQQGELHEATQIVAGNRNGAAIVQTGGARSSAAQIQLGSNNFAFAGQSNGDNRALQIQAGSLPALNGRGPEAAILASASGSGGGQNNMSLLLQSGGNNEALLIQAGSNNNIGLRQTGNQTATIGQFGNGHSIAIEQGRSDISICQGAASACQGAGFSPPGSGK